jgi:hypothetical protein
MLAAHSTMQSAAAASASSMHTCTMRAARTTCMYVRKQPEGAYEHVFDWILVPYWSLGGGGEEEEEKENREQQQ